MTSPASGVEAGWSGKPHTALRCLFATCHTHLPERVGGSESTTHDLCLSLQACGWACAVLARLDAHSLLSYRARLVRRLLGDSPGSADRVMGYPVYRRWQPVANVATIAHGFHASLAVVQAGTPAPLVEAFRVAGIPTILYVHDVEFDDLGGSVLGHPGLAFLANSRFTAARVCAELGVKADVLPPLVRPEAYRVEPTRRRVVFVNPVPVKGVDIAFALAESRPDIPFDFVEAWELSEEQRQTFRARAGRLPNVRWRERVRDMRRVYAEAKLLLVPSRWREAWGRVVTEAQVSGIPVLASDRGGLPESVGPGGILVNPDAPLAEWRLALSRLWDDPREYDAFAEAARAHAQRPEIQPDVLLARFMQFAVPHVESAGARPW